MLARIREVVKTLALWVTFPLWFPVLFVVLGTEIGFLPSEWRLRRQMKRAGRTAPLDVLRSGGGGGGGTVIHDRPTFSWGVSRLWWTADDVLAQAPVPPLTPAEHRAAMQSFGAYRWHEFDRWVSQRYLDPEHGTAALIAVWHPERTLRRIRERCPGCRIVESFSGGGDYERHCGALDAG